jgi:hypothetical protein
VSGLLDAFIAKPVGPAIPARLTNPSKDFTSRLEVRGEEAVAELRRPVGETTSTAARTYLEEQGLDPAEWEQTGYRRSEWTMPNGDTGESARFVFKRRSFGGGEERPDIGELIEAVNTYEPPPGEHRRISEGKHTFIVALGDMQFGKADGDGVEGTLQRTIDCLGKALLALDRYRLWYDIGHVHLAFLGDHVEGFVSQGGANTWRTPLTLTEQIRLVRRVMLHAVLLFAPECSRLTVTAVPGNHGEAVRINGKGVTRYDDSHDTEALISVKDATDLSPERFGHVEYFVPDSDELTTVVDCSGTVVAHAHGHQWRPGKELDWWKGQAFNKESAMHQADLLLAGHLHHAYVNTDGPRTFVQVPAMESESTWWRHSMGTTGAPGLMVMVTEGGMTPGVEVVR